MPIRSTASSTTAATSPRASSGRTDDALALNGGGGEIFRNFFYLPDRALSLSEFIWTFYSQFDPASAAGTFREDEYMDGLARRRAACARRRKPSASSRRDVELLYPAFRCRYWTGRNTSVNNRFGWALTPFVERRTVASAVDVPIAFKNHGRFEAALINAFSPSLARYPSAYGHDFAGDVPLKRRIKDQLTLLRPPLLRRYAFRIKARMQPPAQDDAGPVMAGADRPVIPADARIFPDRPRARSRPVPANLHPGIPVQPAFRRPPEAQLGGSGLCSYGRSTRSVQPPNRKGSLRGPASSCSMALVSIS